MQTRTEAASHQSQANGDSLWVGQGQAAASIGLEVWKKVEVTDPDETKSFNKGGFQGTAIAPIYQVKRATEAFGPIGLGWGVELISEAYIDGKPFVVDGQVVGKEVIHKVYVELWYLQHGFRGSVKQFGATVYITRDAFGIISSDEDHAKKSFTDATSKCLSLLGFSADVFTGKFDDSKYVEGLRADKQQGQASDATAGTTTPDGAGQSDTQEQATSQPPEKTRYQKYKDQLTHIEQTGQTVKDVRGTREVIAQDKLLSQMEIQTLLQSPLLRLPADEHDQANAQTDKSSVFL
ncbi:MULTISPECIES: hypothetical protein [Pseudomonas]|uniref:Uncharacterized protein n=5 Tax=Pseudomonas TaxID=286 RepID=A0A3G1DH56_PSEAI|nr:MULTISPECIES: hypothetical protein [Pseudomonas]AXQ51222.1 hypothetical protein DZC31_31665 [Stenotrophomonas rhizophila]AMP35982.1 Hypothetical protein [Pseudomonas aeruginosa]ESW38324.1 hypothetical protein O164_18630 [Pseudomonas taiwanensis SJ9]MBA6092358.1 hypothetical protein [Pseudomonas monteilii]MCE0756863.1 hypothetical protein [Pseudomonas asiatica]